MENFKLKAENREIIGKKVKQLRRGKTIPAVLYGKGFKNRNICLDLKDFTKIVKDAGSSSLVNLSIADEKAIKILIGNVQNHPVTSHIIHADLLKINMKEKIRTGIPLELVGTSPAVSDLEGNLITTKDEIEVECLPDDLVPHITVDISVLKTFEDQIKISDLQIPEGMEVLDDKEEVLLLVTPPRTEEELEGELAAPSEEEAIAELEAKTETEQGEEKPVEEKKAE